MDSFLEYSTLTMSQKDGLRGQSTIRRGSLTFTCDCFPKLHFKIRVQLGIKKSRTIFHSAEFEMFLKQVCQISIWNLKYETKKIHEEYLYAT